MNSSQRASYAINPVSRFILQNDKASTLSWLRKNVIAVYCVKLFADAAVTFRFEMDASRRLFHLLSIILELIKFYNGNFMGEYNVGTCLVTGD
jgi:hypothetical protein